MRDALAKHARSDTRGVLRLCGVPRRHAKPAPKLSFYRRGLSDDRWSSLHRRAKESLRHGWYGAAGRGKAWPGWAWRGLAGLGPAGEAGLGLAWRGLGLVRQARQGLAGPGQAGLGGTWRGWARQARRDQAWRDLVWPGGARRGRRDPVRSGQEWLGKAWQVRLALGKIRLGSLRARRGRRGGSGRGSMRHGLVAQGRRGPMLAS
jgi:hypothetical protein